MYLLLIIKVSSYIILIRKIIIVVTYKYKSYYFFPC